MIAEDLSVFWLFLEMLVMVSHVAVEATCSINENCPERQALGQEHAAHSWVIGSYK